MRSTLRIVIILTMSGSFAWADARSEMAAALVAQADLHPSPVALPKTAAAPRHAAAQSAVKRGIGPRDVNDKARAAANQFSQQAQGQAQAQAMSQGLARQAQAAAAAAAGQAQAQAAKDRATSHPRPR